MTTISSSSAALTSLASLYANEQAGTSANDGTDKTTAGLSDSQISSLVGLAEGSGTNGASQISTLLGQTTTSSGDLSSIIDAIQAQGTGSGTTATDGSTTNATTDQQKAAAMMQSIYQTQQANLFTLLG